MITKMHEKMRFVIILLSSPTRTEFQNQPFAAVRSLFYATFRYHFVIIRTLEQSSTINHLQLPTHRFFTFSLSFFCHTDTRMTDIKISFNARRLYYVQDHKM